MNWNILVNWVDNDPLHWAIAVLVTIAFVGLIILCIKGGILLFRILRERRRLIKQIDHIQQRTISKAETIERTWSSLEGEIWIKRITSTPANMLNRAKGIREELRNEIARATRPIRTKNEREEIKDPPFDWPFWLVWKILYFFSDSILLVIPVSSKNRLQKRLDTLEALEKRCIDHSVLLKELIKASLLATEKEQKAAEESKRKSIEQWTLNKKREFLERLKGEIFRNLNSLIQRASNAVMAGENSPTHGSRYLNFEMARKNWKSRFAYLGKLEKEGKTPLDQLIELFQSFGQNFVPVPGEKDKIPAVELRAKHAADAEKKHDTIVDAFQELSNEMGYTAEIPKALAEAEKILGDVLPEQWANLDDRFQESLNEAQKLLDSVYDVATTLRAWNGLIIPMREWVAWLKRMQGIATGVHHVKLEKRDDWWIKAVNFLEEKIPNLWAKLDIKGLESEFDEIQHAVKLRQEVLAARVGEHATKCSLDPNLPREAILSLRELQKMILQGPNSG